MAKPRHAGRRCQDSASNTASSRCRRFSAQQPPWLPAGGFRQHMNEIAVGSKAVFLCGFNQAVNHCAALAPPSVFANSQFSVPLQRFYTAFHTVIGDLQPPIFQKSDQVWPLFPPDNTVPYPARTSAQQRSSSQPIPIKRPSPAWTGPGAVHIVLPATVPPIPVQFQRGGCSTPAPPVPHNLRVGPSAGHSPCRYAQQPTARMFSGNRW